MRVSAITMADLRLSSTELYRSDLSALLEKCAAGLAVLPAYSALFLGLATGALEPAPDFAGALRQYLKNHNDWNRQYLELHSSLARDLKIYLVAGTVVESEAGCRYHTAYCFNPGGDTWGSQRQTHLTRAEREIGFSRGEELNMFDLDGLQAGMVVGNDARHPEVGRIFALRGAALLLHCGALEAGYNCWPQVAGMWSQVQQNQFWAVEAQLKGKVGARSFGAPPAVIGPCEITPGQSGYLARGYPHSAVITAELDEEARRQIRQQYPLLELLNPAAYSELDRG